MYTVLDENLQVKGRLSLNNGQGNTTFFSDTITTQMATDNANDPAGLTTVDYTNQDKQGNAKQWSHTLTISVEATNLGTNINTTDYLMYFDSVADHYYLMKVINTSTDRNSGFITVSAINAAIFELGKQLIQAEQTLAQVDLKTFVSKMYKNVPFSLRVADDNLTVIDYVVSANTSLQALLQDLQTKYDVDVDSWVELDETGRIVDRVLYFGHLGSDNGELIRYGGAKGFENMTATEVSDIIYTKLYVTGKTDDKDATKGHIGTVNNGLEYITDDDANQLMYAIGASQQQPVYLEGTITNSLLSEPKALLEWAKQQIGIFNHPRFNYTVSPLHDQIVAIGDTVTVQDFHVKPEILVTSKVIQKTTSFASPESNTFVLGEFSSIFTDNMNKGANVITLIKKDVTVVQEAADYAKAQADAAHAQAVIAQEQAIHAQTSADGKTTTFSVNSLEDLPQTANEGDSAWVTLSDGVYHYVYLNGKWVKDISPDMGKEIAASVDQAVTKAQTYADQAIQTNQQNIDASIKAVDDKANKLKSDQAVFDAKAQGYANQALNDAKNNTIEAVQQTVKNTTDALEQAKSDLTSGIAKEATDRQNALNALDSKTTGAINSARSDAQSALNALQIGSRNLFLNSKDYNSSVWSTFSKTNDTYQGTNIISRSTDGTIFNYDKTYLSSNNLIDTTNTFTLSFKVKNDSNVPVKLTFGAGATNQNASVIATVPANGGWTQVFENVNFWTIGGSPVIGVGISDSNGSGNVSICALKFEKGNKYTDYTQSPEDIIQDYTNRDNQITQSFTQYQQTNDGNVTKAQSDATQALGLVATKVSQTDFDTKTGDLNTKYTNVQQTVDGQTTEIADIKQTATDQSAKINTISSDVDGTKQTISDIQTTQGKQSGSIATLQSRADGFDATVTKVNSLKVGGNNLILGTSNDTVINPLPSGWQVNYNFVEVYSNLVVGQTYTFSGEISLSSGNKLSLRIFDSALQNDVLNYNNFNANGKRDSYTFIVPDNGVRLLVYAGIQGQTGGIKATLHHIQLENSNIASDWTPAPEDLDSATAKAQLTADQATTALSNYKTDADGRISKAQADITATAKQVQTKVSQTDYDQKTGDLSTKVSTAQQTADSANTTIGDYKKANDGRVSSAESAIEQNKDAISSKVSQTDYDKKTGKLDGDISSLNQTAKDITTSVSKVSDRVDSFNTPNLFQNSEFETDTGYGVKNGTVVISGDNKIDVQGIKSGAVTITNDQRTGSYLGWRSNTINVVGGQSYSASVKEHFSQSGTGKVVFDIWFLDSSSNRITSFTQTGNNDSKNYWNTLSAANMIAPNNATELAISLLVMNNGDGAQTATFTQPMVTATDKVKPYTPNITDKQFSTQQQKIDSISSVVSDPNTGLTQRVQTAEGFMTDAKDRLGKVENKSTETADGLTREINDRTDGDSNTLQQGKDFTTSQISNSETGMKSFVNQTISGLQIGAISNDVDSLKNQVNWQQTSFDDMNYMNVTGNFLVTSGAGTNSPFTPWFYIKVDSPRADRITQTIWKDQNNDLIYRRVFDGNNWSTWSQVVSSSTLLSIFHDSWSLGTSTNDGITKQMVTGIMGQPDGTLILKGNSLILDGNTTVTGDFYAKGGNFDNINASHIKVGTLDGYQVNIANVNVNNLVGDTITGFNFNVNKQMTIASGGIIQSDVIHMDKDSFTVRAPNINSHRISSGGYKVSTRDGVFNINSVMGAFSSDGNISVSVDSNTDPYKRGIFHSEYGGNNLMMSATGYTNSDPDEFLNMSSARLDYMYSKTGLLSDATQHTSLRANLIETTGTLNAFSGTQTPNVYSYPNLNLESKNQSVVLIAGGKNILQARENGYLYLLNRYSGSGGSSLQIAGDGAFFMQSSATKYKEDIQYDGGTSVGDKFLTLDPATWQDKDEYEQRKLYRETGIEPTHQIHMTDKRYYGLIAEDLVKAGLEEFVVRDEVTGEVNGLEYDKVAISLIPVVREQRDAINELRLEVERLKQK